MSLTHGHFYAAGKVRENLAGDFGDKIRNNLDAYHLGSIGHDIIYWAGTYQWREKQEKTSGLPCFILPSDPHQFKTGEMIQNLVRDYITRRNAIPRGFSEPEIDLMSKEPKGSEKLQVILNREKKVLDDNEKKAVGLEKQAISEAKDLLEKLQVVEAGKRKDIGDEYNALIKEGQKPIDQYCAFILGWITHWATDLYIHSLVDIYGGRYEPGNHPETFRHTQLEFVETKYILEKMPDLSKVIIPFGNNRLWGYFARPLSKTYDDAKILVSKDQKSTPDERPDVFSKECELAVWWMSGAKTCAEDCCRSNSDGTAKDNQQFEQEWSTRAGGAHFPSQDLYDKISLKIPLEKPWEKSAVITIEPIDPIKIFLIPPEYVVRIADTGLYGKFLKDYDPFIKAAIKKATVIISAAATAIDNADKSDRWVLEPPISGLCDIDILLPENNPEVKDSDVMQGINDDTTRNIFTIPAYQQNLLYYEIEYELFSECHVHPDPPPMKLEFISTGKIKIPGKYQVITGENTNNRLLNSRTGNVLLPIDIPNPEKLNCSFLLRMSLTNEKAFKVVKYQDIEFKEFNAVCPGKIHRIIYNNENSKIEEGDIINEGKYRDYPEGKRTGRWVFYYNHGQKSVEGDFKDDKKHGHWINYSEDGRKTVEGDFKDDKTHGHWIEYFGDGKKSKEGDYCEDIRNDLWISYFEDGHKESEGYYLNGEKNGKYITYYETGQKHSEEEYMNGVEQGLSIIYYETGQKYLEKEYKNGLLNGHYICFFENGGISLVKNYLNDSPTGHWIRYYESGAKNMEGEEDGDTTEYYQDGHVHRQTSADGHTICYDQNGNKTAEFFPDH